MKIGKKAFIALALVTAWQPLLAQTVAAPILGKWHGTSTCIRASGNASCNDEETFYQFVAAPSGLPRLLLHAYKRVGNGIESMGDLEFIPDNGRARWTSDFNNSRVHIQWQMQVGDSGLMGTLVTLPSMQATRLVRARRDSAWKPSGN